MKSVVADGGVAGAVVTQSNDSFLFESSEIRVQFVRSQLVLIELIDWFTTNSPTTTDVFGTALALVSYTRRRHHHDVLFRSPDHDALPQPPLFILRSSLWSISQT